jgi:protein subunit release factor A
VSAPADADHLAELLDERLERRLAEAVERFQALNLELSDPEVARDPDRLKVLGRERSRLEPVARAAEELREVTRELAGARQMAHTA